MFVCMNFWGTLMLLDTFLGIFRSFLSNICNPLRYLVLRMWSSLCFSWFFCCYLISLLYVGRRKQKKCPVSVGRKDIMLDMAWHIHPPFTPGEGIFYFLAHCRFVRLVRRHAAALLQNRQCAEFIVTIYSGMFPSLSLSILEVTIWDFY